jgi:hypothetical protein
MAIWNVLLIFEIFYDHLVHFVFTFGAFFPVLVSCSKKNLATLNGLASELAAAEDSHFLFC